MDSYIIKVFNPDGDQIDWFEAQPAAINNFDWDEFWESLGREIEDGIVRDQQKRGNDTGPYDTREEAAGLR
jgi:hypothetical protein